MVLFIASTVVETTRNMVGMSGTLCDLLLDREGVVVLSRMRSALSNEAGSNCQGKKGSEVDHGGLGSVYEFCSDGFVVMR